jgi:hypothetical protein
MILTIAHTQYVSAVYVDMRPLHVSLVHVGQKVRVTHFIALVLYSSKGARMCTTQSGGGGDRGIHPHPRQVVSRYVTTHIISHVLYSKKNPTKQSVRNKRPLHVPCRPTGARMCPTQSGGGSRYPRQVKSCHVVTHLTAYVRQLPFNKTLTK